MSSANSMTCRAFRKSHMSFIDGLLSDRQTAAMFAHRDGCEKCARIDVAVRRGLLVARNLPDIQPSPDFMVRLQERLHRPNLRLATGTAVRGGHELRLGTVVAVAVLVLAAVGVRFDNAGTSAASTPTLPAVTAMQTPLAARGRTEAPRPVRADEAFANIVSTVVPTWMPGISATLSPGAQPTDGVFHTASVSP
jgi:hypothetical protein